MIYNLAVERFKFIYIYGIGLILEVIGIVLFHSSLADIVKIVLITNIFLLISMLIYNRKEIFGDFVKSNIASIFRININPE
jgi:hypothetical protein